jgi:hypothetical protein
VAIQGVCWFGAAAAAIARGKLFIHQHFTEIPEESCQATILTECLVFDLGLR